MKTPVYLNAKLSLRYWEDCKVNGSEPEFATDVPMLNGNLLWDILININEGRIEDWPSVELRTHFKVCDAGSYYLIDEEANVIAEFENEYVPKCLYPNANGWGDYVILDIDKDGFINGWNPKHVEHIYEK